MIAETHPTEAGSPQRTAPATQPARRGQEKTFPSVRFLRHLMEVVVLGCVVLAPWAFGAAEPAFELLLNGAVGLLLALWGLRMLLEWRFTWRKCPVVLCLAGLILTGMLQLVPLPRDVLGWLSPATASLYERLLPATPEALSENMPRPGSTLSLYPGATQRELLRLLAVVALFAVVRNNLASASALRRLCVAATANGALLALLGLLQWFTSPHHTLYWTFPSPGQVFGPFVYRSHFAFYANLCIGLGFGLLLSGAGRDWQSSPRYARTPGERVRDWLQAPLALLQAPRVLWVAVALGLMVCGVFFSLSRGGVLALFGAGFVVGVVALWKRPRGQSVGGILLGLGLATGLALWFGLGSVQGRLATLWDGKALEESRLPLWKSTLPLIRDFPLWGTGYGTFQHVEPRHRSATANPDVVCDHAHNEYLEALVEGGILRLAWSLLAILAVVRLGWRAVRQHEGRSTAALALGGLFAVMTMVLHSVGDFGLHLPAITFLAAVVCAQLCGMDEERISSDTDGEKSFSFGGIAPVLGTLALLLVGLLLVGESWRADRVEKWRLAAHRLDGQADPESRQRQAAYLEQAARIAPESAVILAELGQVELDAWEQGLERLHRRNRACEAALLASAVGRPIQLLELDPILSRLLGPLPGLVALEEITRPEEEQLARTHLAPSLKHFLQARDLCPLLVKPQLRLAAHAHALGQGDLPSVYQERAEWLSPFDRGVQHLRRLQGSVE